MSDNIRHRGDWADFDRKVETVSGQFTPSAEQVVALDAPIVLPGPDVEVIRGRLALASPSGDLNLAAQLSLFTNSTRRGEDCLWRADVGVGASTLAADSLSGDQVTLVDSSAFVSGDLVKFGEPTIEYARIASISGDVLTLEDDIASTHVSGDLVSLVAEFGGITYVNLDSTAQLHAELGFGSAQTLDIDLDLLIRR